MLSLIVSLVNFIFNLPKSLGNFIDGIRFIKGKFSPPEEAPIIPEKQINMFDISEDEFFLIAHLLKTKFDFERDYIPESEEQKIACNKLTNRGAFDKNADGSYKITQAGINMIFVSQDSQ